MKKEIDENDGDDDDDAKEEDKARMTKTYGNWKEGKKTWKISQDEFQLLLTSIWWSVNLVCFLIFAYF